MVVSSLRGDWETPRFGLSNVFTDRGENSAHSVRFEWRTGALAGDDFDVRRFFFASFSAKSALLKDMRPAPRRYCF